MGYEVRISELQGLGLKPRAIGSAMRRTMLVYPLGWNERYLPLHFGNAASGRYAYAPRSGERGSGRKFRGSYTHRKLLRYHHTRPLEYTGEGRARALGGKRATSTRETATAIVPARVFNFRNPHSRVDMRGELTKVLEPEQDQLETLAQRKLDAELARAEKRR